MMNRANSELPSPPEGEGLGERGTDRLGLQIGLPSTFPLSLTLSLQGRGNNTPEERRHEQNS